MPECAQAVAEKALQLGPVERTRCYLAFRKRPQSSGVANLADETHSGYQVLQVLWIVEVVRLDPDRVGGIGPRQVNASPAFRTHSDRERPGSCRRLESRRIFSGSVGAAVRIGVKVRCVQY